MAGQVRNRYPKLVVYTTYSLRYDGAYWARLDTVENPARPARIEAQIADDGSCRVAMDNADRFHLDLAPQLVGLANSGGFNFALFTEFASVGFLLVVLVALFCGDTVASEASWGSLLAGTIMVGDAGPDVGVARRAGIPVIGVEFGYTDVPIAELKPDRLIGHMKDLPAAVESLMKFA